jgi:hypothetical protein
MEVGINFNKAIFLNKKLKNGNLSKNEREKIQQTKSKAIFKACSHCAIGFFYAIGFLSTCALFVPVPPVQMVGAFIIYGVMAINSILFPTFYCVEKAVYPKEKKKMTKTDKINTAINISAVTSSTVLFSLGTVALFIPEPVVSKVLCGVFIGLGASLMLGLTGAKLISKLVNRYKLKKKLAKKAQAVIGKTQPEKTNNIQPKNKMLLKNKLPQKINNQKKISFFQTKSHPTNQESFHTNDTTTKCPNPKTHH